MKTVVLDSHPLIAYFEKEAGWEKVSALLQEASEEKCRILLNVINWGEVLYITLREYGNAHAEKVARALDDMPIEIVEATKDLTLQAAHLKARGGLSYADCFAAGMALMHKHALLLTGDREFERIADRIEIQWM